MKGAQNANARGNIFLLALVDSNVSKTLIKSLVTMFIEARKTEGF